jgi:hypothetical protein
MTVLCDIVPLVALTVTVPVKGLVGGGGVTVLELPPPHATNRMISTNSTTPKVRALRLRLPAPTTNTIPKVATRLLSQPNKPGPLWMLASVDAALIFTVTAAFDATVGGFGKVQVVDPRLEATVHERVSDPVNPFSG